MGSDDDLPYAPVCCFATATDFPVHSALLHRKLGANAFHATLDETHTLLLCAAFLWENIYF